MNRKEDESVLAFLALGIGATAICGIIVYKFPGQKYPKDNACVAMIGFGFAYMSSIVIQTLISGTR